EWFLQMFIRRRKNPGELQFSSVQPIRSSKQTEASITIHLGREIQSVLYSVNQRSRHLAKLRLPCGAKMTPLLVREFSFQCTRTACGRHLAVRLHPMLLN